MASANREMGTQMSVIQACASGTIDRDAQSRWCRAFHSKFRSSVAVADLSVPPPLASPRTRTISNCSEMLAPEPWNSRKRVGHSGRPRRSEESRVGQEWVSQCSFRWSRAHEKKKAKRRQKTL